MYVDLELYTYYCISKDLMAHPGYAKNLKIFKLVRVKSRRRVMIGCIGEILSPKISLWIVWKTVYVT